MDRWLVCLVLLVLSQLALAGGRAADAQDAFAEGFRNVPMKDRMRLYWRIFGPAWTKPEIDRQLKQMKDAGLGGTVAYFMYPVEVDDPARGIHNQKWGSPEFLETFAYAAKKAQSLGLRFGVNGSSGWPFGGPTVSIQDAAMRARKVDVPAGADIKSALKLAEGESVLAVFEGGNGRPLTRFASLTDLSLKGRGGPYQVFIAGPCGMRVKRPAFGGEGLAVSHYETKPLMNYLRDVINPMAAAGGKALETVGCDSLEVYGTNWSSDFPTEFRKRRGYDIVDHLPELFAKASTGGPAEASNTSSPTTDLQSALNFDFWRTLAELCEERFTKPLGEWCRKKGVTLEMEAYGIPPCPMTSYRYIDMPTGEHYEWKGYSVQKFVASSANLCGRRLVGSEAWTWAGLPNRLADSLSDIKLVSDMAFINGMNDITGVDFPYSPEIAGSPGWLPYYGPVMSPASNPQWRMFPALVDYLNRCQFMLRQGRPVRDVAVYTPTEDAMAEGGPEQILLDFLVRDRLVTGHPTSEFGLQNAQKHHSDLLHGLITNGLDYDGIDFWAMNRLAKVKNGRLEAGWGSYRAIVLPNLKRMEVDAFQKVSEFCESGGTVVVQGAEPWLAAGLGTQVQHDRFLRIRSHFLDGAHVPVREWSHGKGVVLFVDDAAEVGKVLAERLKPAVRLRPTKGNIAMVRRQSKGRDILFFANLGDKDEQCWPEFSSRARYAYRFDPLSGRIEELPLMERGSKVDEVVFLHPRQSVFILQSEDKIPGIEPKKIINALGDEIHWDIAGPWTAEFEGQETIAPPTGPLTSWTEWPSKRFYSGIATYRTTLRAPETGGRTWLHFESVCEAAEIVVNGKKAGVLFCAPWEIEIGHLLKPGENTLEVTVANLPVNRFIGLPDQDLAALRKVYGARFSAPEEKKIMKEPAPSGIIGRVWLSMS